MGDCFPVVGGGEMDRCSFSGGGSTKGRKWWSRAFSVFYGGKV